MAIQDDVEHFITRVRRMARASSLYVVINVCYSAFPFIRRDRQLLRIQLNGTQELAEHYGAEFWPVLGMDAFVVFPESAFRKVPEFVDRVTANFFPDRVQDDLDLGQLVQSYNVPGGYGDLRQRANDYLEVAAARAAATPPCGPAPVLDTAGRLTDLEGPLSARLVGHLEDAVEDLDIGRYLRSQTVFRAADDSWEPFYCEYFTGVEELHREHFPKVQMQGRRRLFHEFCQCLDEKMLSGLGSRRGAGTQDGGAIGINLGIKSVSGPLLSSLGRATARVDRSAVVVELDVLLLLEDVAASRRATGMLRDEGYRIAVDGVTLDLLGYISPERFDADFFKVHVAHDRLGSLNTPESVAALRRLGREKVIFCRCDHEMAVTVGRAIGCDKFQGRLIDRLAGAA